MVCVGAHCLISAILWLGGDLLAQGPRIDSVTPAQTPIAGGAQIDARGAHLAGAKVTVDGAAVSLSSASDDGVRFDAPKHDNGYAILRLETPAGTATATLLYIPPRVQDLPPGYITTIAGIGNYYGDFGPAQEALVAPWGLSVAGDGSLYVAEAGHDRVIRIGPDGIIEPFAGSGFGGPPPVSGDGGPAVQAPIAFPRDVILEANGDLIIPDSNHRIRRVDARTGIIRTIAGTGKAGFAGDGGNAIGAVLNNPTHLAGDGNGTVWFIDSDNFRIRRITPDGKIDTICGNGQRGFAGDGGPATQAQFSLASADFGALAYDPAGFLYLNDQDNLRIRRIDLKTGIIETFIGPDRNLGSSLHNLRSLLVAPGGDVYFFAAGEIIHTTREGTLVERFGVKDSNTPTFEGTPISKVRLGLVQGMALDAQGNLLFSDATINRVMRLNRSTGLVERVAGISPATYGQDRGALSANLQMTDIALLPNGELLGAGTLLRVLKLAPDGGISVVAGTGTFSGPLENGKAIDSPWGGPSLELAPDGSIYMATTSHVVKIDPQGIVHRFAGIGDGGCAFSGDGGPATAAGLCQPWDAVLDHDGNLMIADTNNNRIRRVDARTGIITTIAGSGAVGGYELYGHGAYCGDGSPAVSACLNSPFGLAVNSLGELFVADAYNGRLRKIDRNGIITTVAPIAGAPYLTVDGADNLYMASGHGVFRVTPAGVVQELTADGFGFTGDGGPAQNALVSTLCCGGGGGIAIDAEGSLIFTDGANRRIRAIRYGAVLAPAGTSAGIHGGSPQNTAIGTRFADALSVLVSDAKGNPAGNVRVDFDAPSGGVSCVFSNQQPHTSILTDRFGLASAACIANTLTGTFSVTAKALGLGSTLTFTLTNTAPRLAPNSMVNGASFLSGPVAPGEIVSVFGAGVGPQQLEQAAPVDGRYPTQLAGVRVRFNGTEAPLLLARSDVVAAVAPYALETAQSAQVVVEYAGVASNAITVPVAPASPAIFTADSSGRGQAAALNQDNFVNSSQNPAERGSIVVLFCTGEGQTDPAGVDGKPAIDILPKPKLAVTVTIGGETAETAYVGAAPTLVAGVLQINARVPTTIAPGAAVPVIVSVSGVHSPEGTTLAVR